MTMKPFRLSVAVLGLGCTLLAAEPVADLKKEFNTKSKILSEWFKTGLIRLAQQAKTDVEKRQIIMACAWEWDAGQTEPIYITFNENGTCISSKNDVAFAWTSEAWEVKLISSKGAIAKLKVDPNTLTYVGKDFDGKTNVKGGPRL